MSRTLTVVSILVGLLFVSAPSVAAAANSRRGLLNVLFERGAGPQPLDAGESSSMFTLGTLLGVGVPLYEPAVYVVQEGVVKKRNTVAWDDYLLPGMYALPSLCLLGRGGNSLSMIVPAGLTSEKKVSVGVGFSWGFALKKSAELGVSLALVWNDAEQLTPAQEQSLASGMALPQGESPDISRKLRPSLALGIYLAPQL